MADVFAGPEARIVAILEGTLDVSGLSARAQALAVPAGRFTRALNHAQLRDPRWWQNAGAKWDRAYALRWVSSRDHNNPNNELDGRSLIRATVEIHVGYFQGPALATSIKTAGGETQAVAAIDGWRRALADSERIKRALTFYELHQAGVQPDPPIVLLQREGPSRVEELTTDRLVAVTPYEIALSVSHASVYDP